MAFWFWIAPNRLPAFLTEKPFFDNPKTRVPHVIFLFTHRNTSNGANGLHRFFSTKGVVISTSLKHYQICPWFGLGSTNTNRDVKYSFPRTLNYCAIPQQSHSARWKWCELNPLAGPCNNERAIRSNKLICRGFYHHTAANLPLLIEIIGSVQPTPGRNADNVQRTRQNTMRGSKKAHKAIF